ncbi:MAG: hypothetical protein IPK12_00225 [Gemmatimonadetes bacterium]|nr:hypothetical protein [Gemmatimonadota bacterium]
MPYATGTAADVNDLATKFKDFLLANGWTVNRFDTQGSGKRLEVTRAGVYVSTRWLQNENGTSSPGPGGSNVYGVLAVPATGYSGAADWNTQAGIPLAQNAITKLGVGMPLEAGAISAYHFFTDATTDRVWCVVRKTGNVYGYLGFGVTFTKYGVWTGGAWACGTRSAGGMTQTFGYGQMGLSIETFPPGYGGVGNSWAGSPLLVRIDVDTVVGKYLGVSQSTSTSERTDRRLDSGIAGANYGAALDNGWSAIALQARGRSTLNTGLGPVPIEISAERTDGLYSPIGRLPDVYAINITDGGFPYGSEVTVGTDTYVVFPTFALRKAA